MLTPMQYRGSSQYLAYKTSMIHNKKENITIYRDGQCRSSIIAWIYYLFRSTAQCGPN